MTATLLALVVAVLTVIAYALLAERVEYSSVRRRQLDVWAATTAFLCMGGIVYGAVATRARREAPPAAPVVATPAGLLPNGGGPPGGREPEAAVAKAPAPVRLLAPDVSAVVPPPAAEPVAEAPGEGQPEEETGEARWSGVVPVAELPSPVPVIPPGPTAAATSSTLPTVGPAAPTATRRSAQPTATAAGAVATRVAPPPAVPTRMSLPPTVVPPTSAPMPLPTSTPSCGDPALADLSLTGLSAVADRSGDEVVIRYRAQVRNGASFPVTLADISATAINRVAGSEQYGHGTAPDVAVEPGAVITLEGTVSLNKLPPPFGTTELCLSFVLESCGLRSDRPEHQCSTARGF